METPALINADPSWPLRCPPILSGDLSRLNEKQVNAIIENWLDRALHEAMPANVKSILFTGIKRADSRLNTDVRMILREGDSRQILARRFSWIWSYNKRHSTSLVHQTHLSKQAVGRSAIVLSSAQPSSRLGELPDTRIAYATLRTASCPATPLDEVELPFEGNRVRFRQHQESQTHYVECPSDLNIDVQMFGQEGVTPKLESIVRQGLSSEGYVAHLLPLLEHADILMVTSPSLVLNAEQREHLGGCGLNILIARGTTISNGVVETALRLTNSLDSLFGTVQHLHQMQTRGKMTHEALNTIAHSLKNRADRLSAMYPECARDLYIQKLAAQGAGQLSDAPSKVFFAEDGAQLWRRAGFSRESITESLLKTVWKSHPQLRLDLSPLEDRIADARWVTLIEELMENLAKWNAASFPGSLTLQQNEDSGFATLTVTGTVRPGQLRGLEDKVSIMCGAEEQVQFKGLNTVLAMLRRIVDHSRGASVRYDAGAKDVSTESMPAKDYDFDGLPITLHQHEPFPTVGTPLLPLTLTVQHLSLPPYE